MLISSLLALSLCTSYSFANSSELNNEFSLGLYKKIAQWPGNVFASPFSVRTAMAMVFVGARGATRDQMASALKLGKPGQDGLPELLKSVRALGSGPKGPELRLANGLWAQKAFPFETDFLAANRTYYSAAMNLADFGADSDGTRKKINAWVGHETRDRIRNLIGPNILTSLTRLVLTNAVYFKGTWEASFDPKKTEKAPFYGLSRKVELMHREGEVRYAEDKDWRAIEMPYAGGTMAMLVLLPATQDAEALNQLEQGLDARWLAELTSRMHPRQVRIWIPKFEAETSYSLAATLASSGMPDVFNPSAADLTGMSSVRGLYVTHVLHGAYVSVNEKGTEAAGSTAAIISLRAMPGGVRLPASFRADHPFVYLIRDVRNGTGLFVGRFSPQSAAQ